MPAFFSPVTLLSVGAGLIGGFLSQALLSPRPLMAQFQRSPPLRPHQRSAATEVDAQRFVLVDPSGVVNGELRMEDGEPEIVLYDKDGRIAWRATTHQGGIQPVRSGT